MLTFNSFVRVLIYMRERERDEGSCADHGLGLVSKLLYLQIPYHL